MTALVIGLAVSGRAAVDLLKSQGERVIGYDADPKAAAGVAADEVRTGPWEGSLLAGVDLVVTSPGVPESSRPLRDVLASGVTLWSELELGMRSLGGIPMAAVTGTNGKTTVTELTTSMLRFSGVDAVSAGNIGEPVALLAAAGHQALIVEASSFQLRFIDTFSPDAAAIVNFAPDHLDWHVDVAAYGAAKARIFENMAAESPLVFDADDAGAVGLVAASGTRRIGVSGSRRSEASGRDGDELWLGGASVPLEELPRRDPVMLVDIAVAAELAGVLGATESGIAEAALGYLPGRHRREVVAAADGVTWIDDSKATNPHAALAAIESYPSVVLIAGGRAKGLDVRPLAEADSVRELVAIGESAPDLLGERPDGFGAGSMADAVDRAMTIARPGDVVLLAPGCASFDMFDSYGHRGDEFAAAVRARVGT